MRRGLLSSLSLGLLGLVAGCYSPYRGHKLQGICDCQVYPLGHGTPAPWIQPASAVAPEPPPATATGTIEPPAPAN